tara:strand:- start:813 stop:1928 length:1116 start_codon:yes stop_codon:yes gene_type:complete
MKFKKIFQNLYKNTVHYIFKIIYGNIIYSKKYSLKNNINILEINNKKILTFWNKKYNVFQILHGRIYNDNIQNVAVISKNNIVHGASYQQIDGDLKGAENNICLRIGTPRIKKKFPGCVLNLAQGASGHNNYSHWLLDILPKLKLYSELFSFKNLDYIYLNKLNNFQKSSLNLLNLNNIKQIDAEKYRHIECNELIAVQHPTYFQGYILDQAQYVPEWIVEWLRESFLDKSEHIDVGNKIFIDRSKSLFKHCQIINHDETIKFLKTKGFEILRLEDFSFEQQISIFQQNKVVVSPHGAGLTNLCFSKANSSVIEIRPSEPGYAYQNKVYERISEINNLNYRLYSTPYLKNNNLNGDIIVDTKILNDYLNKI